jgi:hypothetical protein
MGQHPFAGLKGVAVAGADAAAAGTLLGAGVPTAADAAPRASAATTSPIRTRRLVPGPLDVIPIHSAAANPRSATATTPKTTRPYGA